MKTILLSIRPEWIEKILAGEKKVELRKRLPKKDDGEEITVLLYCTQKKKLWNADDARIDGKVVGEATWVATAPVYEKGRKPEVLPKVLAMACVDRVQLMEYAQGAPVYGMLLKDVTEYARPRELEEFGIRKAPQNWCWVEETE